MCTCPACGHANADEAVSCASCSGPLDSAALTLGGKQASHWGYWLAGCVILVIAVLLGLPFHLRETVAQYPFGGPGAYGYLVGQFLGAFLLSALFVVPYYQFRKKKAATGCKFLVYSVWVLAFTIVSAAGSRKGDNSNLKVVIGQLMKEAAGNKVDSVSNNKWTPIIRSFLQDVIAFKREYERELNALNLEPLSQIYQPSSFVSYDQIDTTLTALRQLLAVEQKYGSVDSLLERFRSQVNSPEFSDAEREAFLRGFEQGMGKQYAQRRSVFSKEEEWLQATIDLYEFARQNHPAIRIRDNQVLIENAAILRQYDEKYDRAARLHDEFNRMSEKFQEMQKETLSEFGLSPTDLATSPGHPVKQP